MFYPFVLITTLTLCTSAFRLDADFVTTDDLERYFGKSAIKDLEYDIVNPYVHDENGRRRRQALENEDETKEIKLEAFGEQYHMRLKVNTYLLRDNLEVEQLHGNGTIERLPLGFKRCYYIGQLLSHNTSQVAVSTCKGMRGIISMQQQDILIAPLTDDHAEKYRRRRRDVDNPHIVYRRSVDTEVADVDETKEHFCALDDKIYKNAHYYHDAVRLSRNKDASATQDKKRKRSLTKRETSTNCEVKFLEVRVMVDRDMVHYYGNNVMNYALTLMNVVAARFAEPSLGTLVHIHIAKLETILTDAYYDADGNFLSISANGEQTVDSLNTFQRNAYIRDEDDPNHWDAAILITRKNLQDGNSNSLLGIAFQEGACNPVQGAAIIEDSGLASGQTLAHEIGHMLGMEHDGSGSNSDCQDRTYIMSVTRVSGPNSFAWSKCSKRQLETFLSNPDASSCLNDAPPNIPEYRTNSADFPGYTMSIDQQCQQLDSVYVGWCGSEKQELKDVCGRLACLHGNREDCFYEVPAAEGTVCGLGKWCVSGECVATQGQFPTPVDGSWSSWGSFGECSRTCGGGIRKRLRCCDSPKPEFGGLACQGKASELQLCNTQSCESSQRDFADEQCAATNNIAWRNDYLEWQAYYSGQTEQQLCEHKCISDTYWVVPRGQFFADGTRCSTDGRNEQKKCFKGACLEFGCDDMQGSPYRFDKCHVCNGDGTSCTRQSGQFKEVNTNEGQFTPFLEIPAGATSIEINDTAPIWLSVMALKESDTNQYLFGSNLRPESGEYYTNGIFVKYLFTYTDGETLFIEGPTPVDFTVEVYRANNAAPSITYSYYIPNGNQGGTVLPPPQDDMPQTTKPQTTVQSTTIRPDPTTLHQTTKQPTTVPPTTKLVTTQPPTTTEEVKVTQAPIDVSIQWLPFNYGECSGTCGTAYKTRLVWCVKFSGTGATMIPDAECNGLTKPVTTEECETDLPSCAVEGVWDIGEFSQCSKSCETGYQTRSVICRPEGYKSDPNPSVLDESECKDVKPNAYQICTNQGVSCDVSDHESPVIVNIPTIIYMNTDPGSPEAVVSWTPPRATDNSNELVTLTSNYNPGDRFPIGRWTVTYTATDGSGNKATASFAVVVTDRESPVIAGLPDSIIADTDPNSPTATVPWATPSVSDNSNQAVTITSNHSPGSTFPIGTTRVIYTATDKFGNIGTATVDVIVRDTEKPIISNIPSTICSNTVNAPSGPVTWTPPTASDNSDEPVTLISNYKSGDIFPTGVTTVTYTARDAHGNQDTESFNVVLTDVANFVIFDVSGDIRVNTDYDSSTATVSWTQPKTRGDEDGSVTLTSTNTPGSVFNVGTTTVKYVANDRCGNGRAFVSFDVIVTDAQDPVIFNIPSDISVQTDPGSPNATVFWNMPTASDNSRGKVTFTSNYKSGTSFTIGTTIVTYRAIDIYGNLATESFEVTVTDTENPRISGIPPTQHVDADTGSNSVSVSWTAPKAIDNSGKVTLTSNYNPGDSFPVGSTTVTYTATDGFGNKATASFEVVVKASDSPSPPATTPATDPVPPSSNYMYVALPWGQCNAACGYGTRNRRVFCVMDKGTHYVIEFDENMCNGLSKPAETEVCDLPTCR